jgi:light-regulated signal transduction histidine kinase (bacteriophytochrome)
LEKELKRKINALTNELNELRSEYELFSYSVSHDLQAPLRAINGYTKILMEDHADNLNHSARSITTNILNQVGQMSLLLEELVELFKTEKKTVEYTSLFMKPMVSQICKDLADSQKNRKISFDIKELPDALGDQVLIKQLWINLINNSVKYSGKVAHAKIEIGYQNKEDVMCYYVKDNGIGFDMKYSNRLFTAFKRLHSNKQFEGTGMGLTIAEKIVSKHKGKIWALSQPNEGATFYFTLNKPKINTNGDQLKTNLHLLE